MLHQLLLIPEIIPVLLYLLPVVLPRDDVVPVEPLRTVFICGGRGGMGDFFRLGLEEEGVMKSVTTSSVWRRRTDSHMA